MKKPLNILLLSYDWRDLYATDPAEVVQKLNRDYLNPEFNHFFAVNWSHKKYYKKLSENIETVHLKARFPRVRPLYDMLMFFYIPFILKKHSFVPDVVIAYDFPMIVSSFYPRLFMKSTSVLFLTNLPRDLAKTRSHSIFSVIYHGCSEFIGKRILQYVFVINETTRSYITSLGISDKKIHSFSPNTITRDKEFISKVTQGFIRTKYTISPDKKILLTVGRMEPEKEFSKLIKVFAELNDPSLILIIVGYGSEESKLRQLVGELGIETRVIFAGQVQREEIWNYYHDSDIFILLSSSEALGLVFWEAMYMKVPVIGTPIGGIKETIGSDGERGYLWDEKEGIEILRDNIKNALAPMSTAIKERAYKYVSDRINQTKTINDIIEHNNL